MRKEVVRDWRVDWEADWEKSTRSDRVCRHRYTRMKRTVHCKYEFLYCSINDIYSLYTYCPNWAAGPYHPAPNILKHLANDHYISTTDGRWVPEPLLNPSAWRHLIPGQYCGVGGFSTWVFKFEPESAKYFKYV
jgi:hypothetical protein